MVVTTSQEIYNAPTLHSFEDCVLHGLFVHTKFLIVILSQIWSAFSSIQDYYVRNCAPIVQSGFIDLMYLDHGGDYTFEQVVLMILRKSGCKVAFF
jgi:hypothetical protein